MVARVLENLVFCFVFFDEPFFGVVGIMIMAPKPIYPTSQTNTALFPKAVVASDPTCRFSLTASRSTDGYCIVRGVGCSPNIPSIIATHHNNTSRPIDHRGRVPSTIPTLSATITTRFLFLRPTSNDKNLGAVGFFVAPWTKCFHHHLSLPSYISSSRLHSISNKKGFSSIDQ